MPIQMRHAQLGCVLAYKTDTRLARLAGDIEHGDNVSSMDWMGDWDPEYSAFYRRIFGQSEIRR